MGVKKLLAEYDNAFMSLHELLYRMAATDNATYEAAAQLLCRLFQDPAHWNPTWYQISPKDLMTPLVDNEIPEAIRCIEQASYYGIAPKTPITEDDEREYYEYYSGLKSFNNYCAYGFDRKEICIFLKSVDIDIEAYTFSAEFFKNTSEAIGVSPRLPDPNTALTEQLTECLNENARLKHESHLNQSLSKEIDDSRRKLSRLITDLKKASEKLSKITAERDALKEQILSGKSKTKGLELIGTLAIRGYGMNIHADKINGINEIVQDMSLLGLSADPKTVSSWLKMAAGKIDGPVGNHLPKK